ncbi:MAG: hypothetical protein DMF90_06775 [Acidobacteria bacterium]|nr:MAG: hypothetical protein DMF90_06775 [Acidobacteriota bacterium]
MLPLARQVELAANVEVADPVASPARVHLGVAIENAAPLLIGREDGTQIALDARVEEKRGEDFGAISEAEGEGAGDVADVRVTLDVIRSPTIGARRPFPFRKHLCRRNEP